MSIESLEKVNSFYSYQNVETVEDSSRVAVRRPSVAPVERSGEPRQEVTRNEVEKTVESLQAVARALNTRLSFEVDENTGKNIIRVIDSESGEVIRQIPPQEMLDIVSKLKSVIGVLFDREA